MNTLHFKYALEIEKTRSITQAAENLYMAQPNLSKAIKELENSLDIVIFRRTSKGVIPTEEGLKFLDYAKQVLIQIDKMESIRAPREEQNRMLKISVPRSGYIAMAFSEFLKRLDRTDEMDISFCETNSLSTIENVRDKGYDFGIIRFNTAHEKYFMDYLAEKNLEHDHLWDFEMMAVMPTESPCFDQESVDYAALSGEYTEIAFGDDSIPYVQGAVARLMERNRYADKPVKRISMFDRGSAMVFIHSDPKTFLLDAPLPMVAMKSHGLIQRKCIFPDNHYKDVIIYTSGHKLTHNEMGLINMIYAFKNEVSCLSKNPDI